MVQRAVSRPTDRIGDGGDGVYGGGDGFDPGGVQGPAGPAWRRKGRLRARPAYRRRCRPGSRRCGHGCAQPLATSAAVRVSAEARRNASAPARALRPMSSSVERNPKPASSIQVPMSRVCPGNARKLDNGIAQAVALASAVSRIALRVVPGMMASGSIFTCTMAGRPEASAARKAASNSKPSSPQ